VRAEACSDGQTPLAAAVADWLRVEILEGRLEPGERIRQEWVASACGTSRIPVREALNRLRDEGLVTLTRHVGARVARLDAAELNEIYLLRECLEPLALAHSVPLLEVDDHRELRGYVDQMERRADTRDPSHWVELDRKFHLASYGGADLPRFRELIDGFWNQTQQYRRAYAQLRGSYDLAHMEHRLLMEAIERRDVEDAVAVSQVHIRRTRLALSEHVELFGRGQAL
jgi:DNA-binding GntR family transcriptional regulator